MDFLERSKVGTTVIHLGKSDIDAMTFVGPGEPILKAFSSVVEPLAGRIVRNSLESMTLVEMRDLLLPKLLSGQVTMREAENMVVAAL